MASDSDQSKTQIHSKFIQVQINGWKWKCLPEFELGFKSYLEQFKADLLLYVRPNWHPESLEVEPCKGITNKLVAIYDREKGLENSREDVVLLRINGHGTSAFIDRENEIITKIYLNEVGLVPPVYCQLKNGLCYGYIPGRALTVDDVCDERMMERIICAMTRLHSFKIPAHFEDSTPVLWQKLDNFLEIAPKTFSDKRKNMW